MGRLVGEARFAQVANDIPFSSAQSVWDEKRVLVVGAI